MGYRLSKIHTATGDQGNTGLADGSRLPKNAPRIEVMGEIDELNSLLGLLLSQPLPETARGILTKTQHTLFELGGELAVPGRRALTEADSRELEQSLDQMNAELTPLREFLLPGGPPPAALCHLARATCRRAERRLVALHHQESMNPASLSFINRLSDLLFVIARVVGRQTDQCDAGESLWQPRPGKKGE